MSLRDRMTALFRPPRALRPIPHGPVTPLTASAPFKPVYVPPPPPHPDVAEVMAQWGIHQSVYPNATWAHFIRALEERHAFHVRERVDREAKLAALQAQPRFIP